MKCTVAMTSPTSIHSTSYLDMLVRFDEIVNNAAKCGVVLLTPCFLSGKSYLFMKCDGVSTLGGDPDNCSLEVCSWWIAVLLLTMAG